MNKNSNHRSIAKAIIISVLSVGLAACGGGGGSSGGGGSAGPTPKSGPNPTPNKPVPKPQSSYKIQLSYNNTSEQKDSQLLQASGDGDNDIPFGKTGQITATIAPITGQPPKYETIINLGPTPKLNSGNAVSISIPAGKDSGSTLLTNSNTATDRTIPDSISITSMTVGGNPVKATSNTLTLTVDGKTTPTPPASGTQGPLSNNCIPYTIDNTSEKTLYAAVAGQQETAQFYKFKNNEEVGSFASTITGLDLLTLKPSSATSFCLSNTNFTTGANNNFKLYVFDQPVDIEKTPPDLMTAKYIYGEVELGNAYLSPGAVSDITAVDFTGGIPMQLSKTKNPTTKVGYMENTSRHEIIDNFIKALDTPTPGSENQSPLNKFLAMHSSGPYIINDSSNEIVRILNPNKSLSTPTQQKDFSSQQMDKVTDALNLLGTKCSSNSPCPLPSMTEGKMNQGEDDWVWSVISANKSNIQIKNAATNFTHTIPASYLNLINAWNGTNTTNNPYRLRPDQFVKDPVAANNRLKAILYATITRGILKNKPGSSWNRPNTYYPEFKLNSPLDTNSTMNYYDAFIRSISIDKKSYANPFADQWGSDSSLSTNGSNVCKQSQDKKTCYNSGLTITILPLGPPYLLPDGLHKWSPS